MEFRLKLRSVDLQEGARLDQLLSKTWKLFRSVDMEIVQVSRFRGRSVAVAGQIGNFSEILDTFWLSAFFNIFGPMEGFWTRQRLKFRSDYHNWLRLGIPFHFLEFQNQPSGQYGQIQLK